MRDEWNTATTEADKAFLKKHIGDKEYSNKLFGIINRFDYLYVFNKERFLSPIMIGKLDIKEESIYTDSENVYDATEDYKENEQVVLGDNERFLQIGNSSTIIIREKHNSMKTGLYISYGMLRKDPEKLMTTIEYIVRQAPGLKDISRQWVDNEWYEDE